MAINAVGEYERQGKEVFCTTGDFDETGELVVTTGFAHIDGISWCLIDDSAPTPLQVTAEIDDNEVVFRAWEATAADNTALVASDAEATISVVIYGRRRQ